METPFLALHGLAVKKSATAAEVARILGEEPERIEAALEEAAGRGEVIGAKGIYLLTPQGQQSLTAAYPELFRDVREGGALAAAYRRFEYINRDLLELFTDWQTVDVGGERIPNEHQDTDYDMAVIDRLGDLHELSEPVLEQLSAAVSRLRIYGRRLDDAYSRVLAGESAYVSGVDMDSYHTVWFELHEDLLRLLGRRREE